MITELGGHALLWSTGGQQTSRLKPPTDTPGRLRMRVASARLLGSHGPNDAIVYTTP
jgi:hypothetical protein